MLFGPIERHLSNTLSRKEFILLTDEQKKLRKAYQDKQYREKNKEKMSEYNKKYNEKNKEKIAEKQKQYYEDNKKKVLVYQKQYNEKNKEKIAENSKQYRENNKEKIAENSKQYRENNKEKIAERDKQYREKNKEKISEKKKQYQQTPNGKRSSTLSSWKTQGLQESDEELERIYQLYLTQELCNACDVKLTRNYGKITSTTACMDHCHKSNRFRHIICMKCNTSDYWINYFC
jgi:hypothetical protein